MLVLYCDFLELKAVSQMTKDFLLVFWKRFIKRARKSSAGLRPTVHLPLMANQLAIQLTAWFTLEDRHKIEDPIIDDQINSLAVFMTDDLSTLMILPKVAHPQCKVVARDG